MNTMDALEALSDRYDIERILGRGGMAVVHLAEERKHHRKVAIKVLKPELAAVLGAERFLAEIRPMAWRRTVEFSSRSSPAAPGSGPPPSWIRRPARSQSSRRGRVTT